MSVSEVWVDPGRLADAAKSAAGVADRLQDAKMQAVPVDSDIPESLVAAACATGSRTAARVVGFVVDRLSTWATTADASASGYAGSDVATAQALGRGAVDAQR